MESVTRMHQCLAEGRRSCGVFLGSNSPAVIELLAHRTELDWAGIDLQHSTISMGEAVHALRAMQAADPMVTPFVRLADHHVYGIQQALDAGFFGLIVPLVESATQAEGLVRKAYYPPRGERSFGGSIRATLYDLDMATTNERVVLLPQVESARGLDQVEAITAVPGVTGVLVGPADLSISCGFPLAEAWAHEPFRAAIRRVIQACHDRGKVAAVLAGEAEWPIEAGFDIIGFGSDLVGVRTEVARTFEARTALVRASG